MGTAGQQLTVSIDADDHETVVHVAGEIYLGTRQEFREALNLALGTSTDVVIVDLATSHPDR
jgi:anti-anti-sigma regulatory factor